MRRYLRHQRFTASRSEITHGTSSEAEFGVGMCRHDLDLADLRPCLGRDETQQPSEPNVVAVRAGDERLIAVRGRHVDVIVG
jgi:hypothetical protein